MEELIELNYRKPMKQKVDNLQRRIDLHQASLDILASQPAYHIMEIPVLLNPESLRGILTRYGRKILEEEDAKFSGTVTINGNN